MINRMLRSAFNLNGSLNKDVEYECYEKDDPADQVTNVDRKKTPIF